MAPTSLATGLHQVCKFNARRAHASHPALAIEGLLHRIQVSRTVKLASTGLCIALQLQLVRQGSRSPVTSAAQCCSVHTPAISQTSLFYPLVAMELQHVPPRVRSDLKLSLGRPTSGPVDLVFHGVHCSVQAAAAAKSKETSSFQILNNVSGYAKPASLTCLLGTSGAGKSTLVGPILYLVNICIDIDDVCSIHRSPKPPPDCMDSQSHLH